MANTSATSMNGHGHQGSGDRGSLVLSQDQIQELAETFESIDSNGDGKIQLSELQDALKCVSLDLPGYEVRDLIKRRFSNRDALTFDEFNKLYSELRINKDVGRAWVEKVKEPRNVIVKEGMSEASQAIGIIHTVRIEEQVAFSDWINSNLSNDAELQKHLPLLKNGEDLYAKVEDGLILCKLVNLAAPETIDERAVNKKNLNTYTKRENLTLALNSAEAIGCSIVNIDADDLAKGKAHLVLGLVWQIIRAGLFAQIDLKHVPGLVRLLRDGETLADLQKLSPEQILMRWVNYQLEQAGVDRRLNNFTTDVKDSEVYTHLMKQIAPADRNVTLEPLYERDNLPRAEAMLREAEKLDCRAFVSAGDVANGVYKLNLAFVANLFNTWPGLDPPRDDEDLDLEDIVEETREERTYRNWMNSMGVNPNVHWLYSDLANGVIIFQLYEIIRPGLVDWKRVVVKFVKMKAFMDQIQNCNYAVDLGKQLRFSLVGIQGKDIFDGNRTLTLGLVWQLMRAYTLTVLAQCTASGDKLATDKEIIEWVNNKLRSSGKESQIRSFQDAAIGDARPVVDLIDAIQPGTIDYALFRTTGTPEDNLANAKYAITVARKIGARIYALPDDIVEVKSKLVMTVFACLMARDYMPNMREIASEPVGPIANQLED